MRTRRLGGHVIARVALVVVGFGVIPTHGRAAAFEMMPKLVTRWVENPTETNRVTVEVSGFNLAMLRDLEKPGRNFQQWAEILRVSVEGNGFQNPMLGSYVVTNATLRFEPQFPLGRGVRYWVDFKPHSLDGFPWLNVYPAHVFWLSEVQPVSANIVSQVFPSAGVLPENLLKFYVHFSAPMQGGDIYRHIHLRNEADKDIELPFLELGQELWNPTMTRLTLFIDPGRIKREVKPLEEVGPALEAGKHYTLVIDRAWTDANGQPLKEAFRKSFKAGPPDRDPPDPKLWKLQPPQRGSSKPLVISFPKPMDHALAQRMIRVVVPPGELVAGEAVLEDQERRWLFTPAQPWKAGPHTVLVQTTIEDLAGNNIGKAFEVDLFEGIQRGLTNLTVKLPFTPMPE